MVENAGSTFTMNENVTGFYCWFMLFEFNFGNGSFRRVWDDAF